MTEHNPTAHPLKDAFKLMSKAAELAFTPQCVLRLSTPGYFAVIDRADLDTVTAYRWHAHRPVTGTVYARSSVYQPGRNPTSLYLHRLIAGGTSIDVDHIDMDGLNNSRANLRAASRSQNLANRGRPSSNTSGHKGIIRVPSGRWKAQITVNWKRTYLGTFATAEEAARAYNVAALAAWGEFAQLNDVS